MKPVSLLNQRVLVVEDEYLLAMEVHQSLESAGAIVVGPVSSVAEALNMLDSVELDAAVLDINVNGVQVFPVADALQDRGVPFVFTTGYDRCVLPPPYGDSPRCQKPFDGNELRHVVEGVIARRGGADRSDPPAATERREKRPI